MHLLPVIDDGDRLVRLPLSDAAAMRLADVWMTDDPPQRRQFLALLLSEQPTLRLWIASRVEDPAPTLNALLDWCESNMLAAWRETDSDPVALQASDEQARYWAELAIACLRAPESAEAAEAWFDVAPSAVYANKNSSCHTKGFALTTRESPSSEADPAGLEKRIRDEWLSSSRPFSGWLYRFAEKLRELRRLQSRFAQALEEEKLAALKEFAYGASHEINNPLANISTRAQTLLREERDPERRRKLATINSQAFRAHEMISDLMLFARPPMIEPQPVNLPSLIDRLVQELADSAAAQGTAIVHRSPDHDLTTLADETHLLVALKAICVNALEALAMGGRLTIWSKRSEQLELNPDTSGPWIEIGIHDSGPGIPADVRRHIFDPYFSGRDAGRGLGLGLSKSWRIVNLHGGQIEVTSDDRGTTFLIRLPLQRAARRTCGLLI